MPQRKVWQLLVIGALGIIVGLVLYDVVRIPSPAAIELRELVAGNVDTSWSHAFWNGVLGVLHEIKVVLLAPCLLGIRWLWLGIRAWWDRDLAPVSAGDEATRTPEPARPERRLRRVLPPPPRLGDDPFRDPPRPPAIIIARADAAAALPPVVAEGPGDEPKLLN